VNLFNHAREPHNMPSNRLRASEWVTAPSSGVASGEWPLTPVVAAFVLLFAAMTWKWISGAVTIPWDAKAQFQPQIQFLAQSLARGEWPWWNPFVFAGQPQIADPQSMIFSPPFVLLAFVHADPSAWEIDMTVLAAMAAGGIGMIVYFRDRRWHWAGALIAALVFSFGAAMAWRMQHIGQVLSLAYLPWTLLLIDRAITRASIASGALAGLVAAFLVLGRDQVALLAVYLVAGYVLWLLARQDEPLRAMRRALLPLAAGAIVGAALVTLPILMTALLAADSNRPEIAFAGAGAGSLHPALLLTLLAPDVFGGSGRMGDFWGPPSMTWPHIELYIAQNVGEMYVGALPLMLVAIGLLGRQLWGREIRFFSIALGVMLLYTLGAYTPVFRAIYEIVPGVSLYRRPADAVFLVGALLAVLAGYMTHRTFAAPWIKPSRIHVAIIVVLCAVAAASAIGLGVWLDRVPRLWLPLALAAGTFSLAAALITWGRSRLVVQPTLVALTFATLTAADLAYNNGNNGSSALPPADYEVLEPASRNPTITWLKAHVAEHRSATNRDRVELAGLGFHWPNASMTHRLENTLGYNPVRLHDYSQATGAQDHVGLPDQRVFSPLMPSYRSPLADLLGLRYIAFGAPIETIDTRLAFGTLPLVHQTKNAWIYENTSALPRVLFATRAATADFEALLRHGNWPTTDFRSTVLLEEAPTDVKPRRPGTVAIAFYANTRIVLDADSPDGGFVVLNDIWHPWWVADIDGRRAPILRANVLFRAVAVPPGRHRITFAFHPVSGALRELSAHLWSHVRNVPRPDAAGLSK
jgi:hypothetical protein